MTFLTETKRSEIWLNVHKKLVVEFCSFTTSESLLLLARLALRGGGQLLLSQVTFANFHQEKVLLVSQELGDLISDDMHRFGNFLSRDKVLLFTAVVLLMFWV